MSEHGAPLYSPPAVIRDVPSRVIGWLNAVPYSLLAIPLRLAVANVFWSSGTAKLASWDTTLYLFHDEYRVPFIPPDIAAAMAASLELSAPFLLLSGFFTRGAAAALLGMTFVIEVFVYPQAWPTHIQWTAMLLVLLCRGPGKLSVDHLLAIIFWRSSFGAPVRRRFG